MTLLNYVLAPLSIALIVLGFGMLGVAAIRMTRTVRLGQPDPTRNGPVGPRLKTMLTETLGHTRMLKWGIVGVAHWFVMVG
ncbi:MAG: Fe-S oxidoreductase, partial [Nakamurella sp.]